MVNPALKSKEGQPPKVELADPTKQTVEKATEPQDWTIHKPPPEKVEDPPPKPISQVLIEHLKTVWTAGASAIQVEQVKDQTTPPPPVAPGDGPGQITKESLVYTPSKIKKTEEI